MTSNSVARVVWDQPHPGTGERTIDVTAESTAAAGLAIYRLLNEEPENDADDLRKVTWISATVYQISGGGYMTALGYLPVIGIQMAKSYRLVVTPFDTRPREENGRKVNDAVPILHMLGMGAQIELAGVFQRNPYEQGYAFTRDSNV